MAGTVKKLQFSEGTDVGAPTDLSLQTNTSVIAAYANDAAYISANGAAANGSVYLNTTTNKFRMYTNGNWRNVVPESDSSDPTKTFLTDISGNSTGISATLKFTATGNRTYTFADATDDVVLRTVTQILTNKELTSPLLQTPVIKGATKSIDVDTAANLAIGASVGANNLTLGGSTSTVVIPGNLQVNGTTTDVETTNMQVKDNNIQINQGGNDASAQGAGFTVKRTSTDGSLIYDSTAASKWKAGNAGAEVEVADISTGQILQNKRLHLHTTVAANDATSPRMVLPRNTLSNLQAITSGNHPAAGATYWASDVAQAYVWNGSSLVPIGSSGSGSGEINMITNGSAANDLTGYTDGTSHVSTRVTTGSPLDPVISTAISIAASANASESSTSGTYYTVSTVPSALKNKKLKLEFYFISPASHTFNIGVYSGSTRISLSTDSSGATTLPAGFTGKFTTYLDTDSSTSYTVHFTKTAGTGSATLVITNIIFGPGIQPQGAVIEEWQSYTPTIVGAGTVSNVTLFYRRIGSEMEIDGYFQTGTTAASTPTISLPYGTSINTALIGGSLRHIFGYYNMPASAQNVSQPGYMGGLVYDGSSTTTLQFVRKGNTDTQWLSELGNAIFDSNATITVRLRIPISEWAGSGTVNVAQNDVEFLSNSSTSTSSNDTTSFAWGPDGNAIGNITAALIRRCQLLSPLQVGDRVVVEINDPATVTGRWLEAVGTIYAGANNIATYTVQNGITYGIGSPVIQSPTLVDVNFGQYAWPNGASYGAAGSSWAANNGANLRWRVRVVRSGVAVGFGQATTTSLGLVKGGTVPAVADNSSATSGTIGEYFANRGSSASPTSGSWDNSAQLTNLPAGDWIIDGVCDINPGGSPTTSAQIAISQFAGNTTTDHVRADNQLYVANVPAGQNQGYTLPGVRMSLATATTIYFKINCNFGGTMGYNARISARRAR